MAAPSPQGLGVLLFTTEGRRQYLEGLRAQMDVARHPQQAWATGTCTCASSRPNATELDAALRARAKRAPAHPSVAARFAAAGKAQHPGHGAGPSGRTSRPLGAATLPAAIAAARQGATLGTITVDKDRCTLCLSCVSACPANALQDNPQTPQLRFLEKNCVQCGLCQTTCPENAISLQPRLSLTPSARSCACSTKPSPGPVRCSKPFGTVKAIEAMLGKLAGHPCSRAKRWSGSRCAVTAA